MLKLLVLGILSVFVTNCAAVEHNGTLFPAEINALVSLHDSIRSSVTPSASNMRYLEYSVSLGTLAESWVAMATYTLPPSTEPAFSNTGVSIATKIGPEEERDVMALAMTWLEQQPLYHYEQNSCEGGCREYLQIITGNSGRFGCGYNFQPTEGSHLGVHYLVCLYEEPGNMTCERPYLSGTSCSNCPEDYPLCQNNLCAKPLTTQTATIGPTATSNITITTPTTIPPV